MYRLVITAWLSLAACALPGLAPAALAAEGPGRAWPVGGRPAVVRGWEPPPSPYAAGHRGVDLAARAGEEVRAAAPGTVSFAGRVAGRGVLSITLAGTGDPPLRTTYEPVRAVLAEGAEVVAGQVVAVLEPGAYHCPAVGCLHWGLLRGETYLDPLSLLPPGLLHRGPPRLLPVFGVPPPVPGPEQAPREAKVAALAGAARAPDALHGLALTAATAVAYVLQRRIRSSRRAAVRRVSPGRRAGPSPRRPR